MTIYVHEGMNMFMGDDGPNNSKHLSLKNLKLPTLEENSQKHFAGGAPGEIEVGGLGLKALEITFKLVGFDPQAQAQFGLGTRGSLPYTIYGAYRDKKGNAETELKCVVRGRLGKVELAEFKRGDLADADYKIHEILSYQLWWDGKDLYHYNFDKPIWSVNGVNQIARRNSILRIP